MKKITTLSLLSLLIAGLCVVWYDGYTPTSNNTGDLATLDAASWAKLKEAKKAHKMKHQKKYPFGKPHEYFKYHQAIRTKAGADKPSYPHNYRMIEYQKAKAGGHVARVESRDWDERGPANVPGRTRGLIVDPDDATGNTWFAGSVGGGIWKTEDAGANWRELSLEMPNIAITTMAMSPANTSVLYAGTGEGSFGGLGSIDGNGIFKSTDKGESWSQLSSTGNLEQFGSITRIVVDPSNENILLVSAVNAGLAGYNFNSGIYRSTDGGETWTQTYEADNDVQHIIVSPLDFNIMFAAVNGVGVIKSTDGGLSWEDSSNGIFGNFGRIEIGVGNQSSDIVYAAVNGDANATNSALFISEDGGANWNLVDDTATDNAASDWLGGQGWYDNTLAVHPHDDYTVYLGGIQLWKLDVSSAAPIQQSGVLSVGGENIDFLAFVNFTASEWDGRLELGNLAADRFVSVELRFGPGKSQFAHRFEVSPLGGTNSDGGAGIAAADYSYKDYVEIPFEAWDITNNRQLMVSFRDQQRDGGFNLNPRDDENDPNLLTAREYIYIHDIDYAEEPASVVQKNGGHEEQEMYFVWPLHAGQGAWNAASQADATFRIVYGNREIKTSAVTHISDAYGRFSDQKNSDVHPDHHNILVIKGEGENFRLLNAQDGGVYVSDESTNPGVTDGDWTQAGIGYNTTQFYGVSKKPGADVYLAGSQDNGTWANLSGGEANATTHYRDLIGGDGFETVWHATNPNLAIGSLYNNLFVRTNNNWLSAQNVSGGFTDAGPFISRLANSPHAPDRVYTVGSAGVWYSANFGTTWQNASMDLDNYYFWSGVEVEASLASADIVWAGGAMGTFGSNVYNAYVSTDGGKTFETTNNFKTIGTITSMATHPVEPETAYMIFSVHNEAKIIRTKDLGQTWEDITGFEGSAGGSSNGFPDVAVYSLLVLPHEPTTLWAGTEIGIFESTDDGATWHILEGDLPAVSVWEMKTRDDQVIIATHGRGIWTTTIPELLNVNIIVKPEIVNAAQVSAALKIGATFKLQSPYDKTDVLIDGAVVSTLASNAEITEVTEELEVPSAGTYQLQLIAHVGEDTYPSDVVEVEVVEFGSAASSYETDFSAGEGDFAMFGFRFGSESGFSSPALHTDHPYIEADANGETELHYTAVLTTPIIVASENAVMTYKDVAIVEKGEAGNFFGDEEFWDYVVVEGSKDGENWTPLADGYDANFNAQWGATYDAGSPGTGDMYQEHSIDLLETFSAGDEIFIRFRLYSDAFTAGWGWAIDDLKIQTEDLVSGLNDPEIARFVSAYPNPTSGLVNLKIGHVLSGKMGVSVYDNTGKRVFTQEINKTQAVFELPVDLTSVPAGNYILEVSNGANRVTKKIIRTK